MVYTLKNNIPVSMDKYRVIAFSKETVALSYEVLSKEPARLRTRLALICVDRATGEKIYSLNEKEFIGEEYTLVNSLFDQDGNLTPQGYQYALDNFQFNGVFLREVIEGPEEIQPQLEPQQTP